MVHLESRSISPTRAATSWRSAGVGTTSKRTTRLSRPIDLSSQDKGAHVTEAAKTRLSYQERDRRWARVRALMAREDIDVLVALPQWTAGDALYLSNSAGAVVLPLNEEPTLIAPRADRNPPATSWIRD